jgi:acetyl esterase/lipase
MNALLVDLPRSAVSRGFRWEATGPAGACSDPAARRLTTSRPHAESARGLLPHPKAIALLISLVLALGAMLSPTARVAGKSMLILTELFPGAPARPLQWVSGPPRHEELAYHSLAGPVESDLYLPAGDGAHGAVILYTGVFGVRQEPALIRFAETLARSGAVVMVPESAAFRSGDISPAEVDTLVRAAAYLRSRPEVDPERIGIFGASVGGSLALLAATDEVGRDQLAFVHVFGSYYDAPQMLREVASREIEVDGRRSPWEPDRVASYTFARQLIAALPDGPDREILWRAVLDKQPVEPAELDRLSPEAHLILELCKRPSPERVDEITAGLPVESRERLAAISPSRNIGALKARLYVMHDRNDSFIPFTQARRLTAEAPAGTLALSTESELFKHVTPDPEASPLVLARSLPGLIRHALILAGEFL